MQKNDYDEYWERTEHIARLQLPPDDRDTEIFFLWHFSRESYSANYSEIGIKLPRPDERVYVHVKACYFVPRIVLTVGLTPPVQNEIGIEVGRVEDSRVQGSDRHFIANLQAWYYQNEKTLMLWEVDLFPRYASDDPTEDLLLGSLWYFFEEELLELFPDCERIVTPGGEPKYDDAKWREFLTERKYYTHFENTLVKYRSNSDSKINKI